MVGKIISESLFEKVNVFVPPKFNFFLFFFIIRDIHPPLSLLVLEMAEMLAATGIAVAISINPITKLFLDTFLTANLMSSLKKESYHTTFETDLIYISLFSFMLDYKMRCNHLS